MRERTQGVIGLLTGLLVIPLVVTVVVVLAGRGSSTDTGTDPFPGVTTVDPAAPGTDPVVALWPRVLAEQVVTAPGAVARFDPAAVLPELGRTHVLLAPPDPATRGDHYDRVIGPLTDLARDADLDVLLVTGLTVHVVRGSGPGLGSPAPSGLAGLQVLLGSSDVTDLLVLGARSVADPDTPGTADPVPRTPVADEAEAAPVVAGLRAGRQWTAPGADPPTQDPGAAVRGVGVRVAYLPPAALGAPQPDLLPALTAAFPGEVVVVARGRWVDVGGPRQAVLTSARDYALGRGEVAFTQWGTPVDQLVGLVLRRVDLLVNADPFQRDPLAPTTTERLLARWVPVVALGLAAVLLAGSGVIAVRRVRRRTRVDAAALRAAALGELAALDTELLAALAEPGGPRERYAVAAAAERRDTARALWEASPDPGTSAVVRDAVAAARHALAGADR
ncbi:hypothetical protein GCM10027047_09800 [Rhodococcus aerolatus]